MLEAVRLSEGREKTVVEVVRTERPRGIVQTAILVLAAGQGGSASLGSLLCDFWANSLCVSILGQCRCRNRRCWSQCEAVKPL